MSNKSNTVKNDKTTAKGRVPALRFLEFRDAGEWDIKNLSIALDGKSSQIAKNKLNFTEKGYPVYGADGMLGFIDSYAQEDDYIAIVKDGSGVGNLFFYEGKSSLLGTLNYLFSKNDKKYILKWLYYFLQTISFKPFIKGSGIPHIYYKDYLKTLVLIPSPKEQQKIANCLFSLDDLIEAQSEKIEALKEHKKGLMQSLFPAEGNTIPALRFPEFHDAGAWEAKRLRDVVSVLQGFGFPEKYQGKKDGKYPFYKVSDISNAIASGNQFIEKSANYIDDDHLHDLNAKTIPKGVTIFAKIGEAIRLNRRAITTQKCVIDNNTAGIKSKKGTADDQFVFYLFSRVNLIDYAGGVVPSVNKTTIENIGIVYPQLPEQQKIASFLTSIDDLITAQTQKIDALKAHKKGLMQQLFPTANEVNA